MSFIHPTADVSCNAEVGDGSFVWHYSQLRENCIIGKNVTIGRSVYIGDGVHIGDNSKIQNSALIYEPAILEEGVFVGPGAILTNDTFPRAVNSDGSQKKRNDWNVVGVIIREGASIGAGSVCIAPVEIGAWSLVAAGSIVTKNVPAFAVVAGVPARRINWVGKAGVPLIKKSDGKYMCPKTRAYFFEHDPDTLLEVP
jgi:acetyltransferase-like isoleucine patch superfamily enzyme